MPELPEVETIKKDLEKIILKKKIVKVELLDKKLIKGIKPELFMKEVEKSTINQILRRGKYLIFVLSKNKFLVFHLKLTGQLIYGTPDKKSRIIFYFGGNYLTGRGDHLKCLNFLDMRRFAELRLTDDWTKEKGIREMGPEPFDEDFTVEKFQEMLVRKKTKIKPLLMDQSFLAGVGNIYAQEAVFRVGIHPERPANKLKPEEVKNLHSAIKDVLYEAIKYRGSSVDAYVDIEGEKGGMEQRLQVYGRGGQSCLNCGTLLKEIKLAGRGTTFCPKCQK